MIIILIIAALSFAADSLTQYIPFSVEHRLVSKVSIETGASSTGPVPAYLQTIANDLGKKINLPDDMKVKVSVINSDVVNAFATLDGNIVFFTGLLDVLPNENSLAMVMAHEIAHLKLRHPLRALGRGVVVGLAIATVAGASANGIVDKLIGNTSLLTTLSFTRNQESAADKLAVAALISRYGHAEGATQLFEILSKQQGGATAKLPEFFASHPLGKKRIATINDQIKQHGWQAHGTAQNIPAAVATAIKQLDGALKGKLKNKPAKRPEKKPKQH